MKMSVERIVKVTYKKGIEKLFVFLMIFASILMLGGKNYVKASNIVSETRTLNYADSPADNPLKGFAGYTGCALTSDFPISMEFIVMPLSEIVDKKDGIYEWKWSMLEKKLNEVAASGRQSVVSFHIDDPQKMTAEEANTDAGKSKLKSAIPEYLVKDLAGEVYEMGSGTSDVIERGFSPYYDNSKLWDMIDDFVSELGSRYDGDPRIASIEASIVGFWGEWHTAPYDEWHTEKYDFKLKDSDLIELATAYDNAFNQTQVTIRYPKEGTNQLNVGYSDYSFCHETIVASWSQLNRLKKYNATEYWKKNIGGGELMPRYVSDIFKEDNWCKVKGESYEECLQALHPSWLLVGDVWGFTGDERQNAIKAARQLGYDFTATQATFASSITSSTDKMNLSLNIKNIGIAPFYYNWKVKVGVLNESGEVIKTYETNWDLTQIAADGKEYNFKGALHNLNLEKGKYSLAISVENPLICGKKLRFANETQRSDGWMELGDFVVDGYTADGGETLDPLPTARETYDLDVSATTFSEAMVTTSGYYSFGLFIRNYGTDNYTGSDNPVMSFYKNGMLVKQGITDWNLSAINPDSRAFFSWHLKGLEIGEYDVKLQLTSDTEAVSLGKVFIVNSMDDMNQVNDQLIDYIPESVEHNLNITETDFPEEIALTDDYYKVGVRIHNTGTNNYTGSEPPIMNFYKDGKLVKQSATNWDLSKIDPDIKYYFCWFVKGLELGEHDITLQLTPDTQEVPLGKMNIVN